MGWGVHRCYRLYLLPHIAVFVEVIFVVLELCFAHLFILLSHGMKTSSRTVDTSRKSLCLFFFRRFTVEPIAESDALFDGESDSGLLVFIRIVSQEQDGFRLHRPYTPFRIKPLAPHNPSNGHPINILIGNLWGELDLQRPHPAVP